MKVKKMENWLKSLSIKELKTWIKNNDAVRFFASDLQIKNIELAKEILKDKIDLAIMLDQEDRKEEIENEFKF